MYPNIEPEMNDHHQVVGLEGSWRGWLLVVVALLDHVKHSLPNRPTKNSLREL